MLDQDNALYTIALFLYFHHLTLRISWKNLGRFDVIFCSWELKRPLILSRYFLRDEHIALALSILKMYYPQDSSLAYHSFPLNFHSNCRVASHLYTEFENRFVWKLNASLTSIARLKRNAPNSRLTSCYWYQLENLISAHDKQNHFILGYIPPRNVI